MAEVELESVLEFLRNNGLTQCESALVEDVMEKSQLGSSEFEKLFFPMAPPLRILSSGLLPELSYAVGVTSKSSSDDDFVSLGSSTTELCSSEFTNPYGIRTACPSSQPSSDRLSQFGTARDYPDFEMQNDLFWYKEKDEDFAMPNGTEFYSDKYITTANQARSGIQAIDEACCDVFILEKNPDKCRQVYSDCACCDGGTNVYADHADYNLVDLKSENATGNFVRADGTSDCVGDMDEFHEVKDNVKNKNGNYEFVCDEVVADESFNEGYERKEDDFEIFNLRIIHRRNRTGFEENKDFPVVMSSIIGGRYYVTEFLGSAAFSKVVQAHDLCLGIDVCLKITKNDKDFFDQSLDEIKLLKFVNKHDPSDECHILRLYDYFYFQEHLFIVTELLKANLYEFQKYNQESGGQPYFTLHRLQRISRQCLEALSYLHELGLIHCDLKPENILIKSYRKCDIKIIDLGSSCFETDKLCEYVQSPSYRAPEVMMGLPYNHKIDLWSLGCILVELCTGQVLFPNEAIVMLLARMIGLLGPIDAEMLQQGQHTHKYFTKQSHLYYINEETGTVEYIVPDETRLEDHLVDVSDSCFIEFLKYLLEINPKRRPTAREALHHPWLSQPITCM